MRHNKIKVTVALVCYQEKKKLSDVLEDLKNQTAFDHIGEILLFQNGNCEQTKKTAESFLNQLPLKIFSSSENNLGRARAELVKKSQYDWIVWTDSDCSLPEDWLEQLLFKWDKEQKNNVVAIGGPNRLPENKFWKKMVNFSLSHPLGHGWSPQAWIVKQPTKTSHIPTTNGIFLKQAILTVGNFSEKYNCTGEDWELGLRLKNAGKMILFPSPIVVNNYAQSYFENLKRLFRFGKIKQDRNFNILKNIFTSKKSNEEYKELLIHLHWPLFPLLICFFILGVFKKYFLLAPFCYFLILFLSSFFTAFKSKKKSGLLLPFFWCSQQLSYSLGANMGLILNVQKYILKKLKNFKKFKLIVQS